MTIIEHGHILGFLSTAKEPEEDIVIQKTEYHEENAPSIMLLHGKYADPDNVLTQKYLYFFSNRL